MKKHLTNAAYGVLDYASYPLGMLMVAPIVLHKLGASEYGLWAIATAVVSTGGIVASGFCDANIQRVARLRGTGDTKAMIDTVRSMLGINLVLGAVIAAVVWIVAPFAARHITVAHPDQLQECLISLRIASALIVVRSVESVSASTQRAFEVFRDTVQINAAVRLLTLATAAVLALAGKRTVSIMLATTFFLALGTYLQFRQARKLLGCDALWPEFQPQQTRALLGFGIFTWVQALGSVIFGQFDRVFLGVSLGAAAVAPYALCVQFAQPVFGLTASGLHFLFPYLSGRLGKVPMGEWRQTLGKAFLCNLLLVVCGAGMLLLVGDRLIQAWAGVAVARSAAKILPPIVIGSALMGLSVTGTYAMLALGLFRTVACISLSSRGAILLLMVYMVRHEGLQGLAAARVWYGLFALLLYLPLLRKLEIGKRASIPESPSSVVCELQEAPES